MSGEMAVSPEGAVEGVSAMQIGGIVPALVTPFHDDESLDIECFNRVIEHVLANGVHGVFVAGSQGEFWALSRSEHRQLISAAVEAVGGRVPVYAGASAVSTREAVALARQAAEAGASAVTVLAPHLIGPSAAEVSDHLIAIAKTVEIPVVFYDHPARTGVRLSLDVVVELARAGAIAGVKDSSGDLARTLAYVDALPATIRVMIGNDALVAPALIGGCAGAVASTANVVPRLHVEIYESVQRGDIAEAMQLQKRLAHLRAAFSLGTFPTVVRDAMGLIGIPVGACRAPVRPLDARARELLKDALRRTGLEIVGD